MKQILSFLILIALAASAFSATSRKTIPELYQLRGGSFTSDYSVTYNNFFKDSQDLFGVSSEAGDINNDGIPDFLLSHPGGDYERGIVYVIYGKKGALRQFNSMDDFQPSDGFIIKGEKDGTRLGSSMGPAGDVNGDGIDDIVIGTSPNNPTNGAVDCAAAYVIFGRKSSSEFPSVIEVRRLSPPQGFRLLGTNRANTRSIFPVSGAGDVNGDGVSDIVLGDLAYENVYVIYGGKEGLTDVKLTPAPEPGKGIIIKGGAGGRFGCAVSKAGDFNGDGIDDFVLADYTNNLDLGRAYLIYGKRGGLKEFYIAHLDASQGIILEGAKKFDYFGSSVKNAGDFNGDGLQDILVGAKNANSERGAAYIIFGSRQNPALINMNDLGSPSNPRGINLMTSDSTKLTAFVGGGRDINGDGKSDIIIGAPGYNKDSGAVYVVYGTSSMTNIVLNNLQPSQGFTMTGGENSRFGESAGIMKDINGDGFDDFVVAASRRNDGKGAAYLFSLPWSCPAQCLSCSKPGGSCDKWVCPDGCMSCSSGPNVCDAWRCPDNCTPCKKADVCEACISGFAFINGKCEVCSNSKTHFVQNGHCLEILDKWGPIKNFFGFG